VEWSCINDRFGVDVAKGEHVLEAIFPPRFVTALAAKFCRVFEGAEEHVPNGQVGKVIGVMSKLMVNAMGFRSLEKVTEPSRRFDIPMIEEFADRD
jgi:hypothetical protein